MEKTIVIEPLQKRFPVELKAANREARNRSYANASNCCGARLKQEKKCSSCEMLVASGDSERKIVKIGKQEHLIASSALKSVVQQLEQQEEIVLHAFLDNEPADAQDRYDGLVYALPAEKQAPKYKELAEILKGRTAIGNGVFGNNEYQVVVSVGDDGVIRIRKLVEETQRNDFSPEEVQKQLAGIELPSKIVELERQILDKKSVLAFDVKQFRDMRSEYEEQVIEDFILNGKVPEIAKQVAEEKNDDELERLKALMQ